MYFADFPAVISYIHVIVMPRFTPKRDSGETETIKEGRLRVDDGGRLHNFDGGVIIKAAGPSAIH